MTLLYNSINTEIGIISLILVTFVNDHCIHVSQLQALCGKIPNLSRVGGWFYVLRVDRRTIVRVDTDLYKPAID